MGDVRDVITCAKFQIETFMGYDFTGGRIFDFPIDFSMGLTALPVIQRDIQAVYDGTSLLVRRRTILTFGGRVTPSAAATIRPGLRSAA